MKKYYLVFLILFFACLSIQVEAAHLEARTEYLSSGKPYAGLATCVREHRNETYSDVTWNITITTYDEWTWNLSAERLIKLGVEKTEYCQVDHPEIDYIPARTTSLLMETKWHRSDAYLYKEYYTWYDEAQDKYVEEILLTDTVYRQYKYKMYHFEHTSLSL